jgi:hypothetical protein
VIGFRSAGIVEEMQINMNTNSEFFTRCVGVWCVCLHTFSSGHLEGFGGGKVRVAVYSSCDAKNVIISHYWMGPPNLKGGWVGAWFKVHNFLCCVPATTSLPSNNMSDILNLDCWVLGGDPQHIFFCQDCKIRDGQCFKEGNQGGS